MTTEQYGDFIVIGYEDEMAVIPEQVKEESIKVLIKQVQEVFDKLKLPEQWVIFMIGETIGPESRWMITLGWKTIGRHKKSSINAVLLKKFCANK